MSEEPNRSFVAPSPLVAVAGWLVPGAGYLLIQDYARGIIIGVTILSLFIFGLLVGGVRCLDVPGYNAHGVKLMVRETAPSGYTDEGWVLTRRPIDEIKTKPWSIPQSLVGPLYFFCDWWAVRVSAADPETGYPIAARSHSRINDMGVLYTGVAGMLNLLAVIDAASRAAAKSPLKLFGEVRIPGKPRTEAA